MLRPLAVFIQVTRCAGTAILLKPGIISGGPIAHECPLSRSVGYFLEPVIMLAPFSKRPVQLAIRGVTTDDHDLSVSNDNSPTDCF
jgi:RNA 3'-terminal phosphate cyclase-like protein